MYSIELSSVTLWHRILSPIPDESSSLSQNQLKVLVFIQICSGFLSVIGSVLILYLIWTNPDSAHVQKRNGRIQRGDSLKLTFERIMISLCFADITNSITCMTASFPVPRDVSPSSDFWHPMGNQATCTAQGFFFHLAHSMLYFSTSLAIYFALAMNPKITDERIKRHIEPFLLIIPVVITTIGAVVGLCLNMFNPIVITKQCWVGAYPIGCETGGDYSECTRGKNAKLMIAVIAFLGLLCYAIIIICMAYVFLSSWRQQRKIVLRYSIKSSVTPVATTSGSLSSERIQNNDNNKLRRIAAQGLLYIIVIFLNWCGSVVNTFFVLTGRNEGIFGVSVFAKMFYPLQGFLNLLVYVRPRYIDIRNQNPTMNRFDVVRCIFSKDYRSIIQQLNQKQSSSNCHHQTSVTFNLHTTSAGSSAMTLSCTPIIITGTATAMNQKERVENTCNTNQPVMVTAEQHFKHEAEEEMTELEHSSHTG